MSEDSSAGCASCGIAQVDDIKLKECAECDLVKYCSDECQKNHKSQRKEDCKKRAAELHDEILFQQPESTHLGDCPICCLPLQLDLKKSIMMNCCSKVVCKGCHHANKIREYEGRLGFKCVFCREPLQAKDEREKQRMKRIEANDPIAITHEGFEQGGKGDYQRAFEYYTRAAELGNLDAHYQLAALYRDGHGVEEDKGKEMHHLEEAAIGGHPGARCNLGWNESKIGNAERAVKHCIIAANQGSDESIKALMDAYKGGFVSKENLAATLRAHQAAVDATKSPQREAAEEYYRNRRCR